MPWKPKYIINVGDVFGQWVVLELKPKSRALCVCSCNLKREVRNADLYNYRSLSCGKKACGGSIKELTNSIVGELTVLERTDSVASNGSCIWLCRCSCGKEIKVPVKRLTAGVTKSCGCKRSLFRSLKTRVADACAKHVYASYKHCAKSKNRVFELNLAEFSVLIRTSCYYCNIPPQKATTVRKLDSEISELFNGVDRLDSNIGYTIDNCVACCWQCNSAKSNQTIEEFYKWSERLYQNLKRDKI